MRRLVAILENIRSAENVGSIFRTADATGFSKVYLAGFTPTPLQHKVKKTSLGAENFVAWEKSGRTTSLIKKLKGKGFFVVALEQHKLGRNLFAFKKKKGNIALVVGNEIKGISKNTLKSADAIVEIPMSGKKESLNVAVAFGIAAYFLKELS